MILPLAMSALLAAGAADQGPAPEWLVDAMVQFQSACLEGELRTGMPSQEVQLADLPGPLQRRYRAPYAGRFLRLGADHPSYLIQVTSADPSSEHASVCALAVYGSRHSDALLLNAMHLAGPGSAYAREHRGSVFGTVSGGYVLLGVGHNAAGATPQAR